LTVWRPSTANWFTCNSSADFNCGVGFVVQQFGLGPEIDIPVLRDGNGDGISDFTVWREFFSRSDFGTWYSSPDTFQSGGVSEVIRTQWGLPGDIPLRSGMRSVVEHLYPFSLIQ